MTTPTRSLVALLLSVALASVTACSADGPSEAQSPVTPPSVAVPSAGPASQPKDETPMSDATDRTADEMDTSVTPAPKTELATFGAGCFWCVEAVLEQLDGVERVLSGYMGGAEPNPTYKQVCSGTSGHAEVVQVTFDPGRIAYGKLLDWFWKLHDPTTLNRQGADVGTQYRSVIFFHTDEQRHAADLAKRDVAPTFDDPIVTEISEASEFYEAEGYHQDYYSLNAAQPYCRAVITPKLKKLGLKY